MQQSSLPDSLGIGELVVAWRGGGAMTILIIAIIIGWIVFSVLLCYSLCVAAADMDRRMGLK